MARDDSSTAIVGGAWIEPTSNFTAATYDFTQQGGQTVELRTWQRAGSLGWQSMQGSTGTFTVRGSVIEIAATTGFSDRWDI